MEGRYISIAPYLREHPLLKETRRKKREKYIGFLAYYFHSNEDRYAQALLKLYQETFLQRADEAPVPSPSIKGLWKYRHILYMDVWFINAFQDRERAEALLNEMQTCSGLFWGYRKKMRQLFERLYTGGNTVPFPKVENIISLWQRNETFLHEPVRKIAFTANMSAGKSTLVNAFVGKKVNRSQSMACTAKLHYIYNKPFEDGFSAEDDNVLNLDADYTTLMEDDEGNTKLEIIVSTYFRMMFDRGTRLCFIDTPGVNSAMDRTHKEITDAVISGGAFDRLVYVINADGNIATDDEHRYMSQLWESVKQVPVLFVVNKLDAFRASEDSISESLDKIRQDVEGLGFENAAVCPVSAYAGYLAKRALFDGGLEGDEQDDLDTKRRMFKREAYDLSGYYPPEVRRRCAEIVVAEQDPERQKLLQLMYHCGLLPLEYILTDR